MFTTIKPFKSVLAPLALVSAAAASLSPAAAPAIPSFTITTIAGSGQSGYSGDGGPATSAKLHDPRGIATDAAGNVYFCDRLNNVVRKIDTKGIITTVAGTGVAGYNGDNIQGTAAQLTIPWRVTVDPQGDLIIADSGNDRIRKLAPNGIITTIAGNGQPGYSGDNGPATAATLRIPEQAELDAYGNLYIADSGNNVIRKVDTSGIIRTVAGTGFGASTGNSATGNGDFKGDNGPATQADLSLPVSIAVDAAGDIFISDQANNRIREVDTKGIITTVAGTGADGYSGDGGPAKQAAVAPAGIALDAAGNLYITDYVTSRLRVLLPNGNITTVAGDGTSGFSGDNGPATGAELNSPRQVGVGAFGDVYIADSFNNTIRKLTPGSTTVGETINAAGNIRIVAANAWVTIKGLDLAPAGDTRTWGSSDFVNNQMPTSLDGVSVTMNGTPAYVYYISPTQVNVLAPPNLPAGVAQIQVNNNGTLSAVAYAVVQGLSPTFFQFGAGPYAAAVHANGALIGPASLYPGYTAPAQPGEIILLFGNGFGPTSKPVTAGSQTQSGSLPTLPAVTIGGRAATVQFAGLISPGLYQFNVVVPASAPGGDDALVATYGGTSTQAGVLITVQP